MNPPMVFSAVYLVLAGLGPVLGYYALRPGPKDAAGRVLCAAAIGLTLWTLGLSVAVAAPGGQAAPWLRLAGFGRVGAYALTAHFALISTGAGRRSERWALTFIYLCAAALACALMLPPGAGAFGAAADALLQAFKLLTVGWSVARLMRRGREGDRPEACREARVLALFTAAVLPGAAFDALNGARFHLPLPPLEPLLFLLPAAGVLLRARKIPLREPSLPGRGEAIPDDSLRRTASRVAAAGLISGGTLLVALECLWRAGETSALIVLSGAVLAALGAALLAAERRGSGYGRLEMFLIAASLAVTPLITVGRVSLGGMTIWAFPLMLVVCALAFNFNGLLVAAAASLLFGQAYLWGVAPAVGVLVDGRTYAGRSIVALTVLAAAEFARRMYRRQIRDSAVQAEIHGLISAIAGSFSQADRQNAPEKVRQLVDQLSEFYQTPNALVCAVEEDFAELTGIRVAGAGRTDPPPECVARCIRRWEAFRRERLPEGSAEAAARLNGPGDRTRIRTDGWLIVPFFMGLKPVAFLYVEAGPGADPWRDDQLVPLPFIARVLSGAMEKLGNEARIQFMAYYDALTRLPNRQLFSDRADQAIHLARRNSTALAVMFLDLDYFKSINDAIGHEGGDSLILEVSQALRETLRKTDTIARFGGDEFVILITNIADADHIARVADKVMEIFHRPVQIRGQEVFITASAGVSVFPADGEDAQTLIKHADIAMYTAKEKGKNQYAFCSANMKERVEYRVNLANSLYRALERGELRVYYQPQVNLSTGRISGVEALLRWVHPKLGMIPPSEFIPLAEQTGLINSIGAWVLETAARQAAVWKAQGLGDLRVAVNLSVAQMRAPGLVRQVAGILKSAGVDPAQVELEITESTSMREPDYIIGVLGDLKALGVTLSIDDFGTEYSSLNRLKILPVDRLKMDVQFVRGIDKSPKDRAIAVVIMDLAKSLNLKLVAEGVETRSQLDFLKERMCDEVQGFYYYRPMPADEVEKVLRGAPAAED